MLKTSNFTPDVSYFAEEYIICYWETNNTRGINNCLSHDVINNHQIYEFLFDTPTRGALRFDRIV